MFTTIGVVLVILGAVLLYTIDEDFDYLAYTIGGCGGFLIGLGLPL